MENNNSAGGISGNTAPGDQVDTSVVTDESVESTEEVGDEGAELQADGQQPVEKKEVEKKIASLKKKLKLKVDGEEYEEEIDWDDEEGLRKKLQYSKVAQKRMQEKAALEAEVEDFLTELRKNPRKVLSDPTIGIDIKRLAADIIEEEIENSKKSPEQLEKEKLEARLRELEDEREKEKESNRQRELERLQQQEFDRYDMLMSKALEKSDLPKSPYIVKKMADYMLMGLNNGLDVTPEDVLPLVREELQNDLKEMFAVMPEEVIEAIIGKDVFGRIRKKNIAKAKTVGLKQKVQDTGASNKPADKPVEKKTFKDFFGV